MGERALHGLIALQVLGYQPGQGDERKWFLDHPTLLAEIGFFPPDDDLRAVLDDLLSRRPRPRVKDAAAELRRMRLGRGKPVADRDGLVDALIDAMERYAREHDGCTYPLVMAAASKLSKLAELALGDAEAQARA